MKYGKKGRIQLPSAAQSILLSIGSVFSLATVEAPPVPRQSISAARDAQALGSDWSHVGSDLQTSINTVKEQAGFK